MPEYLVLSLMLLNYSILSQEVHNPKLAFFVLHHRTQNKDARRTTHLELTRFHQHPQPLQSSNTTRFLAIRPTVLLNFSNDHHCSVVHITIAMTDPTALGLHSALTQNWGLSLAHLFPASPLQQYPPSGLLTSLATLSSLTKVDDDVKNGYDAFHRARDMLVETCRRREEYGLGTGIVREADEEGVIIRIRGESKKKDISEEVLARMRREWEDGERAEK